MKRIAYQGTFAALGITFMAGTVMAGVTFTRDFSPLEGRVVSPEKPYRQEICLNGTWQFQPVAVPAEWVPDRGIPPELRMPESRAVGGRRPSRSLRPGTSTRRP
jgi:hypothetical protein